MASNNRTPQRVLDAPKSHPIPLLYGSERDKYFIMQGTVYRTAKRRGKRARRRPQES